MIKFGPSGNSESFYALGHKSTKQAPKWLKTAGLDAYEYEAGNGIAASAASVIAMAGTTVLMALNVMSAGWSEQVGNALHAALVIVSAPMICGQNYALSLFMWGILLMASVSKMNNQYRR